MAIDTYRAGRATDAEAEFGERVSENATNNFTLVTADGKVLGSCLRESLASLLEKWNALPAEQRQPGAIKVPELRGRDARWAWADPPAGSIVLKVFARNLKRDGDAHLVRGDYLYPKSWPSKDAYRDSLWITRSEWQALVPKNPQSGDVVNVPDTLRQRVFRFCLNERFRTYDRPWKPDELRGGKISVTVNEVSKTRVRLRFDGFASIASDADTRMATNGYDGSLLGWLEYDRDKQQFTRFDVLALGESWWNEPSSDPAFAELFAKNFGRITVGVSFQLAPPGSGFARIPPGSHFAWSKRKDYLGKSPEE